MERHLGLDWLRIGAFALLIFYHVGMVFVPWNFHVKTAHPADWVAIPMLATSSWRLMLLFVVSGYAARALLSKGGAFVGARSRRLLIPLLFAMVVVVPVQPWIELMGKYGYADRFGWFWLHEYFGFHALHGIVLPTWQHLWFVAYLWVYTMILAAAIALLRGRSLQRAFDRPFGGIGVLAVPIGWLLFANLVLFQGAQETHALFDDWIAHLHYLPGFLFGFALAGSAPAMAAILRWWRAAGVAAILSYAVVAAIEWHWPGSNMPNPPFGYIFAIARTLQGWCAIIALIGIAERFWNRDHRWRATLTEAVFPFYIIHQTVIVGGRMAAAASRPAGGGGIRHPDRRDHRRLLGILSGGPQDRLVAAADRAARDTDRQGCGLTKNKRDCGTFASVLAPRKLPHSRSMPARTRSAFATSAMDTRPAVARPTSAEGAA